MFMRKTITTGMMCNAHDPAHMGGGLTTVATTRAVGMASGTLVATDAGWMPVEQVRSGDKVLTFDGGMQPVTHVDRDCLWQSARPVPEEMWPILVPAGALGNDITMTLMPGQAVMVKSETGETLFDDPFSLIRAAALVGYNGISRVPPTGPVQMVTLHFQTDQVVFANAAALVHCPSGDVDVLGIKRRQASTDCSIYHVVDEDDAAMLVTCLEAASDECQLWQATNEALRDSAA